jgi:hypothetical protein
MANKKKSARKKAVTKKKAGGKKKGGKKKGRKLSLSGVKKIGPQDGG